MSSPPMPSLKADTAVRIEIANDSNIEAIAIIEYQFQSHKRFCCCLPLHESADEITTQMRKKYAKCPDMMNVSGFAVDASTGAPLGFIQLGMEGMPCELGKKPIAGELYVDSIAVLESAQGKVRGIFSVLLPTTKENI